MKAALPPGRLAAGWDTLLTQAGGLKQCGTDVRVRLQGERDYQMSMDEFARWKAALSGRPHVAFHSYPALNHLFIAGTGKSVPAEYDQPSHVAEPVVVDIAAWITR
jgi:hypothetical protein